LVEQAEIDGLNCTSSSLLTVKFAKARARIGMEMLRKLWNVGATRIREGEEFCS